MFSSQAWRHEALACVAMVGATLSVAAQPAHLETPPDEAADWRSAESGVLSDHVQLTFPQEFLKAGEAYFDPTVRWVVFQAIPRAAADDANPATAGQGDQYQMYVAKLKRDANDNITGIEKPIVISAPGTANTCGYFHPSEPWRVMFGSTLVPPSLEEQPGYQRGTSRYRWAFPAEMEIVERVVPQVYDDLSLLLLDDQIGDARRPHMPAFALPLFERPGGYDAECAYSPDGRHIVFASVDPNTGDSDLWIYDALTQKQFKIVEADGYDGGPFFSPNGWRLCYRSDRRGDNELQLFVADLKIDEDGAIVGVRREMQLTDNHHVNWAPYWHPSGEYLIYATSEVGHHNYEVFAIEVPGTDAQQVDPATLAKKRITQALGFDGLPVFCSDGQWMMWTSQRGEKIEGEERPSSQIWAARVMGTSPK